MIDPLLARYETEFDNVTNISSIIPVGYEAKNILASTVREVQTNIKIIKELKAENDLLRQENNIFKVQFQELCQRDPSYSWC